MGLGVRRNPRGAVGGGRLRSLLAQSFPVTHMRPSQGIPTEPGAVDYLFNLMPFNGYIRQRPPFRRINASAGPATAMAMGQLWKADGTVVTWVLGAGGSLHAVDWNLATITEVVTTANLTTAGITVSGSRAYWCVFNNTVVFNDGTNRPWTWDGTSGAGGLTSLTNAPSACYGRPTSYYSKLFFIKNSDRRTIVWSEENTANTGYEAGGYSNVWVLANTTSAPLKVIHGTNNGLYYFRETSIGVIRGAVNAEFTTTPHDDVSGEMGCPSPEGVAMASRGELWFVNQTGNPCVIPAGGRPQEVPAYYIANSQQSVPSDGFGYNDLTMTRDVAATRAIYMRSSFAIPYPTVWFASDSTAGAALVVHADTARLLCWIKPFGAINMVPLENLYDDIGRDWYACYMNSGYLFACGQTGVQIGEDQTTAGSTTATTRRFISAPLGGGGPVEYHFDALHLAIGGAIDAQLTGTAQLLTSRRPHSTVASNAQSWATTTLDTDYESTQHVRLGLNQSGRWARIMVASSGAQGFAIHDVRVDATPESVGSDVP